MKKGKINKLLRDARSSARVLATLDTKIKNKLLRVMSHALLAGRKTIERANKRDLKKNGHRLSDAMKDRLLLTRSRIESMASSLEEIARLKDPVGRVYEKIVRPNGLLIAKMRVPLGVILIVYESRPNVTSDCVGLCLKSGNAVILRGGSEALSSNVAIYSVMEDAARKAGLPKGAINMVKNPDRSVVDYLLSQDRFIDLVIPRGGESLIRKVASVSRIPVIKHYKGVCHTFIDKTADLAMAARICVNAKVQRPGVCNAMETLLVHERVAKRFLPKIVDRLRREGVVIKGCSATKKIVKDVKKASERDWFTEYLDLVLSVRVVRDVSEAIAHISKYGSQHSDSIVTRNKKNGEAFLRQVDSSAVYVNASTRFTDGKQFGKGAEIGISTDKIHARGPMGIEELTTYKYVICGKGQIRK